VAVKSKYGLIAVPFNEDMLAICICIEHINAFQQHQFLMPENTGVALNSPAKWAMYLTTKTAVAQ